MRRALPLVLAAAAACGHPNPAPERGSSPALPVGAAAGRPAEAIRYDLEATLDPAVHTVHGRARIRWRNTARAPVRDLYLHLYLNAFRSAGTVFMRESGGTLRGARGRADGGIALDALLVDGEDLLPSADRELVPGDETQLRVPLGAPLAPGASVALDIPFRARLPAAFARAGHAGSFHMVAQWYPKVARVEPDGRWASFPYHGRGEFYADFADHRLSVTTPRAFLVGATGRLVDERVMGPSVTRVFEARAVVDVAFAAWDEFREVRASLAGVETRVLFPTGYDAAVRTHLEVLGAGLLELGDRLGPYPYDHLTVIVPPRAARGVHAMEYPTLFVTAGPWFPTPGVHAPSHAGVTAHELAHQWFQALVATNEVEHPMLDEGLAQWAGADVLRALYGADASAVGLAPASGVDVFEAMRTYAFGATSGDPPPAAPAHAFPSDGALGRAVYARTALTLETVRRTWGATRFDRALRRYVAAGRFAHPVPRDLYAAFDAEYWDGFSRAVLVPGLERAEDASARLEDVTAARGGTPHAVRVRASRDGALPLPLTVRVRDVLERERWVPWPATERTLDVTVDLGAPLREVQLDPYRQNLLDRSRLDDRWSTPGPDERVRGVRLAAWVGALLAAVGP